jgi:hypothetical protein
MTEEQTERFRLFYYENVHDPATKYGYLAADIFWVVSGLWFLWAMFGHH